MYKIDQTLRQEYLDKHLPYRVNSMLSTDLIAYRRGTKISNDIKELCYKDSLVLEPAFEISIIFGRALLQFLGIGLDGKTNCLMNYQARQTDLTIKSIYPNNNFVQLDEELVISNRASLCTIIKVANKSVAHLTSTLSNENEHNQLRDARMTIYQLMLKYVPDINRTNIWWHEQVEKMG